MHGTTLIEVLISLLVLSLVLLGMDAMQIMALQKTREAYLFSVATQQLNVLTGRLYLGQAINLEETVYNWNEQNKQVLPESGGEVRGHYPSYTLTIFWGGNNKEYNKNKSGSAGCISRDIVVA